jgi:hypothetical protein
MHNDFSIVLVVGFILIVIPASIWINLTWSGAKLQEWARRRHFIIVEEQYCWLFKGPFTWNCYKGQTVHRVVVEDRHGEQRSGYVKLGSWIWGLWSDDAAEEWNR